MKVNVNVYSPSSISKLSPKIPGILLTSIIGFIALTLGNSFPLIGGAVSAITLGVLIKNLFVLPEKYLEGIQYTLKKLLKVAIILLGFGLSFTTLLQTGLPSLLIVIVAVTVGFSLTYLFARLLGLQGSLPLLIGAGTGICGATAIATTGPILQAKQEEIAYAINTIFTFNVLAVFLYPMIGQWLSLSDIQFGIWSGAAIHDTSSVVASGYMFSEEAGDTAVVVKLMRTLMLIPFALAFALYMSYKTNKSTVTESSLGKSTIKAFPGFILLFVLAVLLNTWLSFPSEIISTTSFVAKFLIIMVMVSVGLETDLKKIKSVGFKPLLVGLISSVLMGLTTLGLIYLFY